MVGSSRRTIIAVVGSKGSGKTTVIEILTRELSRRGFRLAAVKHIHEADFTIDKKEKDTWRFAQSGAKTIVGIAPKEIGTIEKRDGSAISIRDIIARCHDADIVLLEGFKEMVRENAKIPKIVTIRSAEEASTALESIRPILVFAGLHDVRNLESNVLYVNVTQEMGRIVEIVEKNVGA